MSCSRKHRLFATMLTVIIVVILCCQPAFAESDPKTEYRNGIDAAYSTLRKIATGGGAIALAGCGIILLSGSEKDMDKAKTAIRYILIAVACVWILPLFVKMGKTLFKVNDIGPWNPHSLK